MRQIILLLVFIACTTEAEKLAIKIEPAKKIPACYNIRCPYKYEECDDVEGNPVCVLRCPSCDGVKNASPVCGSDGKTYVNECVLKEVECMERKNVDVLCQRECPCDPKEVRAMDPELVDKLEGLRIQVRREEKLKKELLAEAEVAKTITMVEVDPLPEKIKNFMTKDDVEALYSRKMRKWLKTKEEFKQKERLLKELEQNQMNLELFNKPAICTPEELLELPSRLIDWFHVLKAISKKQLRQVALKKMKFMDAKLRSLYIKLACKNDPTRPDSEVFCLEPVQWMFDHLDINNDMVLDHTELLGIEDVPTEHCLKKFFLGCDTSGNGTIEKKEFCRCLCVEPPCTREMENVPTIVLSGVPEAGPELFVPTCDEDGFFMPKQCDLEECWCVDRNGGENNGTRVKGDQTHCDDNIGGAIMTTDDNIGGAIMTTDDNIGGAIMTIDAPLPNILTEKIEKKEKKPAFVEP